MRLVRGRRGQATARSSRTAPARRCREQDRTPRPRRSRKRRRRRVEPRRQRAASRRAGQVAHRPVRPRWHEGEVAREVGPQRQDGLGRSPSLAGRGPGVAAVSSSSASGSFVGGVLGAGSVVGRPARRRAAPPPVAGVVPARPLDRVDAASRGGAQRRRARRPASRSAGPASSRSSSVRPSSSRTRRASGFRGPGRASPGRPSAIRASRAASGASATPCSTRIASIVADPDRTQPKPGAARADGRQQRLLGVGAQDDGRPRPAAPRAS